MTVGNCLAAVKALRPSPFTDAQLVAMLNEVEGLVQSEVLQFAPEDIVEYTDGESDDVLLICPPHDKLYMSGMKALLARELGEWEQYGILQSIFESQYRELMCWTRNHYGFPPATSEEERV